MTMVIEDEEESKHRTTNNSCWKRRTNMERRLISTLIIAVLIIIGLAIATGVESSKIEQSCLTKVCVKEAASLLNRMNTTVNPCDDFYEFVCGRYITESVIPEDKTELDALGTIADLVNIQVKTVVTEPPTPNEIQPFVMLKQMYRACMNTSAIEQNSLDQMKYFFTSLGGWPILEEDKWVETDWVNVTRSLRRLGFSTDHFMAMDIGASTKNSSEYVISIDEGKHEEINENNLKLGLKDSLVRSYADYLIDLGVMFGANREFATKEVHDLIEFRSKLAQFVVSKSEHYKLLIDTNITTVEELENRFPTIMWLDLLNGALAIPNKTITKLEKVGVVSFKYIEQLEELVSNTSKRVQVNHALFEVVRSSIQFLPMEMRQREQEFMSSATGATKSRPRWDTCITKATNYFSLAADGLYIRKYGDDDVKKDVAEMITYIRNVFVKLLKHVDWMDNETKNKAVEKAEMMTALVAYAPELRDEKKLEEYYQGLRFKSDNVLELISEVSKFKKDKWMSLYGKPVEKNHWATRAAAITSNAFYDPLENSIQIPAGILQNEFYTKGKPNYMNFGSLGLVIGHEMTHGFDSDGKWFDKMGNVMNWWKKGTDEAFALKAQCFVEQYSNFTVPEIKTNLDGQNTLAENIADNGGVKEAYLAYLEWTKQNKYEPPLPGFQYSAKQLFWISLTNAWCTKSRISSLEQAVLGDEHSPDRYRILGALRNLHYFSEDFSCPLGSNMNPKNKCQIW